MIVAVVSTRRRKEKKHEEVAQRRGTRDVRSRDSGSIQQRNAETKILVAGATTRRSFSGLSEYCHDESLSSGIRTAQCVCSTRRSSWGRNDQKVSCDESNQSGGA